VEEEWRLSLSSAVGIIAVHFPESAASGQGLFDGAFDRTIRHRHVIDAGSKIWVICLSFK
jgi:hypothetical protein